MLALWTPRQFHKRIGKRHVLGQALGYAERTGRS